MKKTILALFALIAVAVAPEIATAQNQNQGKAMTQNANFNRKQANRAMRQAENEAVIARVNAAVKAQQFSFIATELTTSGIASLSNIPLNQLWSVRVTPQTLYVYLPIYGTGGPLGQPSIFNRLDFNTSTFTYNVQTLRNGNMSAHIKATDTTNNRNYTLTFEITPNGDYSTLSMESSFSGPVTFTGNVNYDM